jgi:predicted AlkP superfamily pyrophosphatase or phosphodiesterase
MRRLYPAGALPIALFLVACTPAVERTEPTPPAAETADRPALVVMMVVDQLSQDLLARHEDVFTGGFRRLIDDGRWYVNATHDHAATKTAPGHATLSTGSWPSHHGIVANEWLERIGGEWVEVTEVGDPTVQILGVPGITGSSPTHLMRSGLAEWMVQADPRTLVASVSQKARAAILPAAHARGQVYWFENDVGRYVTSTYYRDRYPEWIERFNADVMAAHRSDTLWTSDVPPAEAWRSDPDTAAYEGDEMSPHFPHWFGNPDERSDFWEWFERTPMLDAATLSLARIVVTESGLGSDDVPDFLNISLSQTDRVGHDFGPLSREQLDNLLRLDRELGEFFAFLDATVGRGRWAIGLSADHGVMVAGQDLRIASGGTVRRWTPGEESKLDSIGAAAARDAGEPGASERLVEELERLDFVADAYTDAELERGAPADSFAVLELHSLYPGRAWDTFSPWGVEVRFVPGFMDTELGFEHGAPYWYDRHVPMIFKGPGISAGRDTTRASSTDFAPTLARFLHIPFPADVDGSPLEGVVGGG